MTDIVKDASLFSFNRYLQIGGKNKMVNVRKRGNVYEYNFDNERYFVVKKWLFWYNAFNKLKIVSSRK